MLGISDRPDVKVMPVVALFEPDDDVAAHVIFALSSSGLSHLLLPDPATHMALWFRTRFDAIIINPFRSLFDPALAILSARNIAGTRPVLALTLDDCAMQRTATLISGADDAIFGKGDANELAMRVLALIRRQNDRAGGNLFCDELVINLVSRQVARAGQHINMPLREFDLLAHLAHSRDKVVTRPELLRAVWRIDFDPGTNRIDVHMSRLRQRIDRGYHHAMLRTVKGTGYALVSRTGAQMASLSN
ncbi:MAG: response regulator transcription factor [Pseudomonadota bacterium]